ncbi:MAG: type II secretion system secretin GspD [Desulfobacterales bacterium]|nr:type II secretion system secretin GspD [Desulfobacterales bacterium]
MKTWSPLLRFLPILLVAWVLIVPLPSLQAQTDPSPEADGGEDRFVSIDFNNVDIRVFIKFVSELTGKNFIIDDRVKGKVTVISPEKISIQEAYHVFESVLEVHGFTTVPAGRVIKIVSSPEARSKSVETLLLQEADDTRDHVVTRIIPLKYADPEAIRRLFAPLISKNSVMLAYAPTGMIVVTDVASNIQRLLRIIEVVDVPGTGREISVVHLKYADSVKFEKIISSVFQPTTAAKGKKVENVRLVADERTNAIVILGSVDETERVKRLIDLLDRETPRGKGKIRVFYLENASAEELAKVLQQLPGKTSADAKGKLSPAVSSDVKITADKATNSLIIQAEKEDYKLLEEIIAKLDIPRSMVYIECLIMEVNVDKTFQIGVEWKAGGSTEIGANNSVFGGGFSDSNYSSINGMKTSYDSNNNPTPGSLPKGFSMGIFGQAINIGGVLFPNIAAIIEAYKYDKDVQILSTPQILTTDNEEAKIYIGANIPFQTRSAAENASETYSSYEYKDVGTSLKITPQISQDRLVRLKISQEVSELESTTADSRPTTLKRTIDTTVIAQDRSTVVIGGLIKDNDVVTETKVPLLGDIPILGWLFRSKSQDRKKSNLFVFLTPRVIKSPAEAKGIFTEKRTTMDRLREGADAGQKDNSDPAVPIRLYPGDDAPATTGDASPGKL